MKHRFYMATAGGLAALVATDSAKASYTGLSTIHYTTVNVGGGPKWVFRVYANFTNANDYFTGCQGSSTLGPVAIKSAVPSGLPGSNFFNPGGASSKTAPMTPDGVIEWGTFVTVGVSLATQGSGPTSAPDMTGLTPGFPNFINGNSLVNDNMGWFTPGPVEQGRAGYLGDGDAQLRVLIMQLTVDAGSTVKGTVAVNGVNSGSLAATFQAAGQTFFAFPPPPAPSGLAVFAIAGLHGRRRRRS